jgi:hypothetical protein
MPRHWSILDGEPWMVNPARLGILGAFNPGPPGRGKRFLFHGAFTSKEKAKRREKQIPGSFVLDRGGEHYVVTPRKKRNPKRRSKKQMATAMQRRMSYVRSFQKNRRRHHVLANRRRRHYRMNRRHRRNYRRNPYPMAGTVASLAGNPRRRRRLNPRRRHYVMMNRRRRYRHNPGLFSQSYFGLPSLQQVGWSVVGFSGTAAIQNILWGQGGTGLIPSSLTQFSTAMKYVVLVASGAITHMVVRWFRPQWAATATIGSGLYIASQIVHDFLPGVIPGMSAYTPLHAYAPLSRLGQYHGWGRSGLASQNIGASNIPVGWASHGAMDILAQRFRRFN